MSSATPSARNKIGRCLQKKSLSSWSFKARKFNLTFHGFGRSCLKCGSLKSSLGLSVTSGRAECVEIRQAQATRRRSRPRQVPGDVGVCGGPREAEPGDAVSADVEDRLDRQVQEALGRRVIPGIAGEGGEIELGDLGEEAQVLVERGQAGRDDLVVKCQGGRPGRGP